MRATILNCTLKPSPEQSNTALLAEVVADALRAQRALERMDAMIAETDDEERPVAYNRVAGVVVTGNEDGAHHVISEVCGALGDIGYTIPGQSWTYWNKGPGPGEDYSETEEGHEWSAATGRAAAANLHAVAIALAENPVPALPSE